MKKKIFSKTYGRMTVRRKEGIGLIKSMIRI